MVARGGSGPGAAVAFGVLILAAFACKLCSGNKPDPYEEARAEQERQDREEAQRRDREREAAERDAKKRRAAIALEERTMTPSARTDRIRYVLDAGGGFEVCEAKRLLAKAADPKNAELREATKIIKVAEQKQLLAERAEFEKDRGLLCVDQTFSPTCTCRGSHQGCCSHHGGVAGCAPYPTEVSCPTHYDDP